MIGKEDIKITSSIDRNQIINILSEIDSDFRPKLSEKIDFHSYAEKILEKALFFVAVSDNLILGFIAFYCNDEAKKNAYISLIGVQNEFRRYGIGDLLLTKAIQYIRNRNYQSVGIETWEGSNGMYLYQKHEFEIVGKIHDQQSGGNRLVMRLWLANLIMHHSVNSPLQIYKRIGMDLNINLFVKRDDLYPLTGGGSKARKLHSILNEQAKQQFNAIVTEGSSQSNHLRATSLHSAILGWKTICIIHDDKPHEIVGNLKLTKISGAELRFVAKDDVEIALKKAMDDLKEQGYNPMHICNGGYCVQGAFAFYEAVKELKEQLGNVKPDYIVVASGTGTTQAGLEVGVRKFYPDCKVLGVSVARDEQRGKEAIVKSMQELRGLLKIPSKLNDDIFFDDHWKGAGYEATYPELLDTIHRMARREGLILDPTYTGKAFHALIKYVERGIIPENSNVVFWHTGGLLNLVASNLT